MRELLECLLGIEPAGAIIPPPLPVSSERVCKSESLQVCKSASLQVCKSAGLRSASLQSAFVAHRPVGDVKLVCLALWRKREYLTSLQSGLLRLATNILQIIVFRLSLFSLRHISSPISKLCYLNLHLYNVSMFSCHRVKI